MMSFAGKTILVVDDEELLREILVDEFSFYGATVHGAENGVKAFDLLQSMPFDAMISDVRMPGGGGLALLENIRDHLAVKPKMFLCSGFNDLDLATVKAMGVLEIFGKPFDRDKMVQAMAKALGLPALA